ncbi:hypothetical protein JCM8097_007535 [Rhodosporidiobolus ruineniae]
MALASAPSALFASPTEHVADNGFEENCSALNPSLFDRVPDEVVLGIVRDCPSAWFLLSKRIDRLARSARQPRTTLRTSRQFEHDPGARARHASSFVGARYLLPGVGQGGTHAIDSILGTLINLRHLTVDGVLRNGVDYVVSASFTNALGRLTSLTSLVLDTQVDLTIEDSSFSLAISLPSLRRLDVGYGCYQFRQLFSPPPPKLEHLGISSTPPQEDFYDLLPWRSLTSLSLDFEVLNSHEPLATGRLALFCGALRKALFADSAEDEPVDLPLRRFAMWISPFTHPIHPSYFTTNPRDREPTLEEWIDLIKLLNLTSVQHLDLHVWFSLVRPIEVPPLIKVTSVTVFCNELEGGDSLGYEAFQLVSLLPYFPSLRHLRIDPFPLNRYGVPDMNVPHPSTTEYLFRHPVVAAVLLALQDTAVVQFSFPYEDGCDYRWTRAETGEPFEAERYRVY